MQLKVTLKMTHSLHVYKRLIKSRQSIIKIMVTLEANDVGHAKKVKDVQN